MGLGSRSAPLTFTVALAAASIAAGCVDPAELNAMTDAQEADAITPPGWTFDPAAPIAQSIFTDTQAADEPSLQAFLAHNYYGTPSVLASYTANGSTAAAALVSASRQWSINPYVLLALAQAAARLVSTLEYPGSRYFSREQVRAAVSAATRTWSEARCVTADGLRPPRAPIMLISK